MPITIFITSLGYVIVTASSCFLFFKFFLSCTVESLERKGLLYKRVSRHAMGNTRAVCGTHGGCQHHCIVFEVHCPWRPVYSFVNTSSSMDANANMNSLANYQSAGVSMPKDRGVAEKESTLIFHLVSTLLNDRVVGPSCGHYTRATCMIFFCKSFHL